MFWCLKLDASCHKDDHNLPYLLLMLRLLPKPCCAFVKSLCTSTMALGFMQADVDNSSCCQEIFMV